ncbi:lymphocyte antigen 86 [Xenopus laevis]|uniref:Lymphocyte antigen 86 n=1 Tax=Xenopus laevis TaxID=8355 RepID=A0A8J0VKS9_XENLA|nr:lymphocyte antigen 86 [Xenopus laevis]
MKIYFAFVISLLLFCPGEMTEWPTHTLCNTGNFQAFYKSCDPLQDFGVDLSLCSPIAQDMKLRFGVLLRHNIKELFLAITAYFNGQLFLNYDYTICESSAPRFSFCGRKKGEFIQIDHPIIPHIPVIPKGEFNVSLELHNEDKKFIGCATLMVNSV